MDTPALHINAAWTQLLTDWLDAENLIAPAIRHQLDGLAPSEQVKVAHWQSLLQQAQALRPDIPAFGLAVGAGVKPRHVGLLGYLVLSCRTLGDAMLAYQRYEGLFYGQQLAEVTGIEGNLCIAWPGTSSTGKLADSVSIAGLVSFLRRLLLEPPVPSCVSFVFPCNNHQEQQAFAQFFGCKVHFNAQKTSVQFPANYLALPLLHRDEGLRQLLDRQAAALLQAQPNADAFERNLQQALAQRLPEGQGNLQAVSSAVHISPRSLQRQLQKRGKNWQQLLDDTRASLATDYLRDATLGLTDIALLLGFSEQSAFSRACKRWTDETPNALRRRLID